jgi:hypothetical protein
VCQPKPNMARKKIITNIINIIRDRIPIVGNHKMLHNPYNDYGQNLSLYYILFKLLMF